MSHGLLGRDSRRITTWVQSFHFDFLSIARGVTDRGVGSGPLLGIFVSRDAIDARLVLFFAVCGQSF